MPAPNKNHILGFVLGLSDANSSEFGQTSDPVVGLLTEWETSHGKEKRKFGGDLGGTMRLGAYECVIREGTQAFNAYRQSLITERHRHRYEVNIAYKERLEAAGLIFSGLSPDGTLPEIIEWKDHPWFVGVQFHPELKSKPHAPHPLFVHFIGSALGGHGT
jgi:CTP synthase